MKYRLKNWKFHYLIDDEVGKLFKVEVEKKTVRKKTVATERLISWKAIRNVVEALEYLTTIEDIPVWKLRTMMKKEEVQQ